MREIKFRVWDLVLEQYNHDAQSHFMWDCFVSITDRYCLEQYTGLKDKNGVEIYEGDIIHAFGAPLEVKWIVDGWFADCEITEICEAGQKWDDNCEVIGNIHESPGLLK